MTILAGKKGKIDYERWKEISKGEEEDEQGEDVGRGGKKGEEKK